MASSQTNKSPFNLRDLPLSRIELRGRRRRLNIGARVRTGASLALGHDRRDGPKGRASSMLDGIGEATRGPTCGQSELNGLEFVRSQILTRWSHDDR